MAYQALSHRQIIGYKSEWYKVGWGGSILHDGRVWTAWPWRQWVKVRTPVYS